MSKKHRFPTMKQLVDGVIVEPSKSGHPLLEKLHATRLRLQLTETDPDPDEILSDMDVKDLNNAQLRVRKVKEKNIELSLEAYAWVEGRKFWYFVGHWGDEMDTPWRLGESTLIARYLDEVVEARQLIDELACEL